MKSFKTAIMAITALAALTGVASANEYGHHRHRHPGPQYTQEYAPLTVQPARPSYDPYRGPGAIVTAPIAVGARVAALPFQVVNGVFPPSGDIRAVVGAPVYFAGQLVQLPFRIAEAPFGGGFDNRTY